MSTATTSPLNLSLERLRDDLPSVNGDWVQALRHSGSESFASLGLPSPKEESWRGTNVTALGNVEFQVADHKLPRLDHPLSSLQLGGPRLVFCGNRLVEQSGEIPQGLWVGSIPAAADKYGDALKGWITGQESEFGSFEALNRSFLSCGAVIVADAGATIDAVVDLVYVNQSNGSAAVQMPRTVIVAGERASIKVVETFVGGGNEETFTNAVSRVVVADDAHVEHARIQIEGKQAWHVSTVTSHQTRNSQYTAHHFNLGAKVARHNTRAILDGEGANTLLNGLYIASEKQHVDNDTVLDHAKPHGDSRELYKGILAGEARSVFTGRIIVRPDAQKTDAKQSNPNLLLSPKALAQTRPQLEIYADDVKCTHGATVGQMDDDAIFYLRSRGLSKGAARNMLIHAVAGEVLQAITIPQLREALEAEVESRLTAIEAAEG